MGHEKANFDTAKVMGRDMIEEHTEAMNMVQSPHKIKIEIACKDLVDLDFGMGTSDPFAILYVKGEKDQKWIKLGQTETINS